MSEDADPYARQKRLPGVGDTGQARISGLNARIPGGRAAAIELAYLVRAGVSRGLVGGPRETHFSHAEAFVFSGPFYVAEGAEGALRSLSSALGKDA